MKQDQALYFFHQGTNYYSYDYMGAHSLEDGSVVFRVWAPSAKSISVVGDFNGWNGESDVMTKISHGVFEATVNNVEQYSQYKYRITAADGRILMKSDPYAFHTETRPGNSSKFFDLSGYQWGDKEWISNRKESYSQPINIYEVHLGSWRTHRDGSPFSYRELAKQLPRYAKDMGYTHIELLPITEYPFDPSWGYQVTGYYAPTSRFGTPHDFMYFIDCCHAEGVGVILDWVPAHFPKDDFGLSSFDGRDCYEPSDSFIREHEDWGTLAFDYGREEVQSFLVSNALFWLEKYHADGIRVDAVASMLYLDFGREEGKWRPNSFGGRENLAVVAFFKKLNTQVFSRFPYALMMAEESTAWPGVTAPIDQGGLGFNYKWNMGWMNDTLRYMSLDPVYRTHHHNLLNFSMQYAFAENYVLALSHDEVVYGKCSLISKMPGSYEQKFSGLAAYLGFMMAHPGKKLLFMGCEFAQFIEWDYKKELDWLLLDYEKHRDFREYVKMLNLFYKDHPAFYVIERDWSGFKWISVDDRDSNSVAFLRTDCKKDQVIVVCNFSGVDHCGFQVGVPEPGNYKVALDSSLLAQADCNETVYSSDKLKMGEFDNSIMINMKAFSTVYIMKDNN